MGLLKQDHNAIKLDLRAAIVLYPKHLSKNGQFKPDRSACVMEVSVKSLADAYARRRSARARARARGTGDSSCIRD